MNIIQMHEENIGRIYVYQRVCMLFHIFLKCYEYNQIHFFKTIIMGSSVQGHSESAEPELERNHCWTTSSRSGISGVSSSDPEFQPLALLGLQALLTTAGTPLTVSNFIPETRTQQGRI